MEVNKVTKVESQKRRKDRVNVYLNGEYAFSCSAEIVYKYNIKSGISIDLEELKEIVYEENYLDAKNQALKTIEKAYKTEKEMRDSLLKKGYLITVIDKVIEFLKEYGFVNDEKFTEMYIHDKIKSSGRNKIKYALIKKGISEDLLVRKLNDISCLLEEETAGNLALKKYNILEKSEKNQIKKLKKIADYLMRNGYNYEIVESIVNKLKQLQADSNETNKEESIVDQEADLKKIYDIGVKRYEILIKSEKNSAKLYKKLCEYLLRRGYSWEQVKIAVRNIIDDEFEGGEFT
ncbi:MAG: recombination regulator RecX [Bacillota bacterium]|nr:recombination regulator RecX [Bacillota bacterium]